MMDRLLEKNYFVALLAVLLAVVLWAQVAGVGVAQPHRTLSGVTVADQGLDTGLYLLGISPGRVELTVRGSPQQLALLNSGSVRVWVNLHGAKPGLNSVAVQVSLPQGVSLVGLSPAAVTARVDSKEVRILPVKVQLSGNLAAGYQDLQEIANPATVQVSGPAGRVGRAVAAQAVVSQNGLAGSFRETATVTVVDSAGQTVSGLALKPPTVAVKVQVAPLPSVTLPVQATVTGTPASGYQAGLASVTPAFLTVRGPVTVLQGLTRLSTGPVSVAGATGPVTTMVPVQLPPNVAAVDADTVQVTVPVTPAGVKGSTGGLQG